MIQFNTHQIVSDNLLSGGYLFSLAERLFAGEKLSAKEKLSESQLHQVVNMYSKLSPDFDIREIENDKTYQTHDGKDFLGKDLKAITALMYSKPRSAYLNNKRPFIYDTSLCAGVPLPMLAFKRHRNLCFNGFRMSPKDFNVHEGGIIECLEVEKMWKLDQLLGHSLASTSLENGSVHINETYGLGMLCGLQSEDIKGWTYKPVRILRELGFGKRRGNFASTFGASSVPLNTIEEELTKDEKAFVLLYNHSNAAVKHLLTQRWAWYGNHRNDDMICDPRNWDNTPLSVDKDSNSFIGIKPQQGPTSPMEFYK